MQEATQDLNLIVKGKQVVVKKEDHYFTEEGTPVIKHAPLKRLAKELGVRLSKTVLEFAIPVDGSMYVAHRAFGTDDDGTEVSAIGEAGPDNVDGIAAQYPVIMSNKRAEDRLLISLLDLEGIVYSEVEFSGNGSSQQAKEPEEVVFPFGKHKGKTMEQIAQDDKNYLEWFTTKFQPKRKRDEQLIEAAIEVLSNYPTA